MKENKSDHGVEKPDAPPEIDKRYWYIDWRLHQLAYWRYHNEATKEELEELEELDKEREYLHNNYKFLDMSPLYNVRRKYFGPPRTKMPKDLRDKYVAMFKRFCQLAKWRFHREATEDEITELEELRSMIKQLEDYYLRPDDMPLFEFHRKNETTSK